VVYPGQPDLLKVHLQMYTWHTCLRSFYDEVQIREFYSLSVNLTEMFQEVTFIFPISGDHVESASSMTQQCQPKITQMSAKNCCM
jgi:hypothetical protein